MIPAWFTQRAFVLLWCISMFCNSLPHDRTPRNLKLSLPFRNPAQAAAHRCLNSLECEQKASKLPFLQARYFYQRSRCSCPYLLPMIPTVFEIRRNRRGLYEAFAHRRDKNPYYSTSLFDFKTSELCSVLYVHQYVRAVCSAVLCCVCIFCFRLLNYKLCTFTITQLS